MLSDLRRPHRTFTIPELKTLLHTTPELFGASYFALLKQYYPEFLQP